MATRPRTSSARTRLMAMARGYMTAQAVLTANEIGIFDALADGPRTLGSLARRTRCSTRGIRALADALVCLGLLEWRGERVANSEWAGQLLTGSGADHVGHTLRHQKHLYDRWARLSEAVRHGRPVGRPSRGPARYERFLRAMIDASRPAVRKLVRELDLSADRSLLDLGGGLGHYAIAFARRWPHLEVTLFDLPEAIALAGRHLRRERMSDRVRTLAGDVRRNAIGGPYDVIFLANVLHIFSPRVIVSIMRRAARALTPRGRVLVKDFVLDDDRSGPPHAGLFGLNMLVATESGGVYSEAEYREFLQRAGLERIERREMGAGSLLQVARVARLRRKRR